MTLYRKVPWLPIYREVTVSCPDTNQILSLDRAESHRKAIGRIEWGIGFLLAGTLLSAALKQVGFQQIGNYVAGLGIATIIHGMITAQIMEHWLLASIGVLILCCGIGVYLFRNKGFSVDKNTFKKLNKKKDNV